MPRSLLCALPRGACDYKAGEAHNHILTVTKNTCKKDNKQRTLHAGFRPGHGIRQAPIIKPQRQKVCLWQMRGLTSSNSEGVFCKRRGFAGAFLAHISPGIEADACSHGAASRPDASAISIFCRGSTSIVDVVPRFQPGIIRTRLAPYMHLTCCRWPYMAIPNGSS